MNRAERVRLYGERFVAEQEAKAEALAKHEDTLRRECALALEELAAAIHSPNVAKSSIERALVHVQKAHALAAALELAEA